jgi:tRNA threonylcarbamoyladenosine biosynthesis protein TsaE
MIISRSAAETIEFGRQLARTLKPGDVVALNGDLGAGKTCLVKGIAAGLGITHEITSPTFTLIHEYPPLAHVDLYRLDSVYGIGLEEYFGGRWITVIEWAEKIESELPARTKHVRLTVLDDTSRQIEVA